MPPATQTSSIDPATADVSRPPPNAPHAFATLPEIADLQAVMQEIADRLPDIAAALPPHRRPLVANALLNLAIERILAAEGAVVTAAMLQRLTELIRNGEQPEDGVGFRLNGHDA